MRFRIAMLWIVSLAIFGVTPLRADIIQPVWEAAYYDNPYFLDPPIHIRSETGIGYDWGSAAPAPDLPADYFSVRWGTNVTLAAGTYRFYVLADDEVKIMVNFGNPLINTFGNARVGQVLSQDIVLASGEHHIQIDYREFGGAASIFFAFESLSDGAQGPTFLQPPSLPVVLTPVQDAAWIAEYFTNRDLSGTPVLIQPESDPSGNWGEGSPDARISDSNWSARWTRNLNLPEGVYQVRVRADDGVRVSVDGVMVIDEWHISTGETFINEFNLTSGLHQFRVEFFEVGGLAYLDFRINRLGSPAPVLPGRATATVITLRLNVRTEPSSTAAVITQADYGDTLAVLGTNAARSWVQVAVNGIAGWVNGGFVRLNNAVNIPIVTVPATPPVVTGYVVTATPYTVNIRNGPGTQYRDIGNLRVNQQAQVIGRNADSTWWQVNYNGIIGWTSAVYARLQADANITAIPITG